MSLEMKYMPTRWARHEVYEHAIGSNKSLVLNDQLSHILDSVPQFVMD